MKKSTVFILIIVGALLMGACGSANEAGNNASKSTPTPTSVPGGVLDGGADIGVATPEPTPTDVPVAKYDGDLAELVDKIYAVADPMLMLGIIPFDMADADALAYYTGLKEASRIKEVAVSESMFGSQAYSLVLVRLNDAADAEAVKDEMVNGINTGKWMCVQADDVSTAIYGDIVMFVMTSSEFVGNGSASAKELTDAFMTVCGDK